MDELTRLAWRARDGEPEVMATFIRATQREVYSLCAYLVDNDTADDLVQETYLHVFRALPKFRRESSARTWLLSIARHICMDELRRRSRRRHREVLVDRIIEHPAAAGLEEHVEVRDLLNRLPDSQRAAFVLTQILGLSYADAGVICQCPAGTIGSRVTRARADMIEVLQRAQSLTLGTDVEARSDAMD